MGTTKTVESKNFKHIIAIVAITGFIAMMTFMFIDNADGKYTDTITLCVGTILGVVSTVYTYEFGSSRGSATKNEMLYNSTKNPE